MLSKAEESFKEWYYNNGGEWNATHIRPVWHAAWNAAKEAAAEEAEKQVTMEGYELEISASIRKL